jgi:hypothetical protein
MNDVFFSETGLQERKEITKSKNESKREKRVSERKNK